MGLEWGAGRPGASLDTLSPQTPGLHRAGPLLTTAWGLEGAGGRGHRLQRGTGPLSGRFRASLRLTLQRLDAMAGACLLARGWVGRGPGRGHGQ